MQNLRSQNTLASPGTLIREHDLSNYAKTPSLRQPVCLIFGFSPRGALLEPRYFSNVNRMIEQYGVPENSLEKYFMNAGSRVIEAGGTAMMTRLPYDNFACNNVKYVRYSVGEHISKEKVYYDDESYEKYSEQDHEGLMALNALNELDDTIRGYSRITLASKKVESMAEDEFYECTYDASKLEDESIYIFDIRKQVLGVNPLLTNSNEVEYLGVVPILVGPSTAIYFQEKIENNEENDKIFNPISLPVTLDNDGNVVEVDPNGIITDSPWKEEFTNEEVQETLKQILVSFSRVVGYKHTGTFYDKRTISDEASSKFPLIRWRGAGRLEKRYLDQLGIVVFEMVFNNDTEKVDFIPRESFVGYIANTDAEHPPMEIEVNNNSEYIYMVRKIDRKPQRDYFHVTNQPIVVLGMRSSEVEKRLNYKKSIMEPIQHVLDSQYADVDSCHIDLIVDAGISTAAHYAWDKYTDTTRFVDKILTKKIAYKRDEDGNLILYGGDPLQKLDYKRDEDGNLSLDEDGNPILDIQYKKTEQGDLILDESGDPVQVVEYEKDSNGHLVLDEEGNPIPIDSKYFETTPVYGPDSTFYFNPAKEDVSPSSRLVEQCSTAWMNLTKMITKFIEYRRGDSLYLADGPRCLNVSRQAPYLLHYPELSNNEILNRYLGYFSDLSTSYGARFWNWVLAKDSFSALSIWMPPSIIAAQVMCQSDRGMFPWYASAGFKRGVVPNAYEVSLKTKPYTDENDILYQNNWNYFTDNMGVGIVLEGNKTMQVEATALDRINVRKLCNYIKRNLRDISNKYKYEPNTEEARILYREDIVDFLSYIQKNSGLEDFAVICNNSNNPREVIERNELRCQVWIKPVKAIEFIIIDLSVTSQDVKFTSEFTHT